jgi:hypothetical protein
MCARVALLTPHQLLVSLVTKRRLQKFHTPKQQRIVTAINTAYKMFDSAQVQPQNSKPLDR